ncbi:MAG TPA: hemerythrin domain-containing protein, partial [Mycobacteriales bacterium]|nr:hemerythrin domain-containing protein [Mycobacteriales bacterium]
MAQAPDETPTESSAAALKRDHREVDAGIEAFVNGAAPDRRSWDRLAASIAMLRRHIYAEEELLFPALREAG